MARRDPGLVYADLINAGFPTGAATTMTAIAGAESGYDDAARGDLRLQTDQWGPSFGLYQIRTLKADTGRGTDRDIAALAGNDAAQAKAAYDISGQGRDFTPWTTFTSGAFQPFVPAAQTAAAGAPPAAGGATFPVFGPSWLPWNWGADTGNAATGAVKGAVASTLGGVRTIAIEGVFVILGLGLLGAGAAVALRPQLRAGAAYVGHKTDQAAKIAATAAAL